ncbi:MAG TPA: hypothetical protein VHM90_11120 [Phycisphaerae bacterium]|jgi:hypothetical protein|nr:hypothetical protein [Phycisphaerae bacterium]
MRASLARGLGLVALGWGCALGLAGCDSTVVNTYSADQGNIVNGIAYDAGVIDVGTAARVVVPEGTVVRETAGDRRVHIYLQKRLAWHGQPLIPTDIHYERHKMGSAYRREGDALILGTYGEWDSKAEGGAYVRLAVDVPAGMKVEMRKGLSGMESPVLVGEPIFDSLQSRPFAAGWYQIKDQPDKSLGGGRFGAQ